ncbi:hypothetical protein [Actinoplanes sp. NPDC051494]|uniref:hypothetical protein n=1 Tax=Actinoplanes sp. NPDC051494 TaxID=3363907 RepID=UPI00378D0F6C
MTTPGRRRPYPRVRASPVAARVLAVAVLLAAGCDPAPSEPAPPVAAPLSLPWQVVELPVPPGAPGRVMLRDVTFCPGHWFAVGAVADVKGGTRPAAWSSPDAVTWSALPIEAKTYYGDQNILATVACRDGRMAAVGAKVGGAHGNPRTSSWYQTPAGALREVTAPFELYGGPQAINVTRLHAGPAGWLITGNRMSGAAAWLSPDAATFAIKERAPGLASSAAGETWAFDGTPADDGWLIVGGWLPSGRIDRDVAGWRSVDGAVWTPVPAAEPTSDYEELQRVVTADVPVALGVRGGKFGAWRLESGSWRPAGTFGTVPPGGKAGVRSLSGALLAATTDGSAYSVWSSSDGGRKWLPVVMPEPTVIGGEGAVAVAAGAGHWVVAVDNARDALIYLTETPG